MNWERELTDIVQASSLIPSFKQWLDTAEYCEYARGIYTGNMNMQAAAINALYDYYRMEMRARFGT